MSSTAFGMSNFSSSLCLSSVCTTEERRLVLVFERLLLRVFFPKMFGLAFALAPPNVFTIALSASSNVSIFAAPPFKTKPMNPICPITPIQDSIMLIASGRKAAS
jgi:hypothetical protein